MWLERSSHLDILALPTHQTNHFKSASLVSEITIILLGESSEISAFPCTVVYSASAVTESFSSLGPQRMLPILICIRVSFCSVSQECCDAKKENHTFQSFHFKLRFNWEPIYGTELVKLEAINYTAWSRATRLHIRIFPPAQKEEPRLLCFALRQAKYHRKILLSSFHLNFHNVSVCRFSSTNSNVRTTLYKLENNTSGNWCFAGFFWNHII